MTAGRQLLELYVMGLKGWNGGVWRLSTRSVIDASVGTVCWDGLAEAREGAAGMLGGRRLRPPVTLGNQLLDAADSVADTSR